MSLNSTTASVTFARRRFGTQLRLNTKIVIVITSRQRANKTGIQCLGQRLRLHCQMSI